MLTFESSKNLVSALQNPQEVDKKLEQELAATRLAGPFSSLPFYPFTVSPLGLVPKKIAGDLRLINHLSFPNGSLVNDGIPSEFNSVQYTRVADTIHLLKRTGPGSYMAKTDIKSAFRIIPIHPDDYAFLGMTWKGFYY